MSTCHWYPNYFKIFFNWCGSLVAISDTWEPVLMTIIVIHHLIESDTEWHLQFLRYFLHFYKVENISGGKRRENQHLLQLRKWGWWLGAMQSLQLSSYSSQSQQGRRCRNHLSVWKSIFPFNSSSPSSFLWKLGRPGVRGGARSILCQYLTDSRRWQHRIFRRTDLRQVRKGIHK